MANCPYCDEVIDEEYNFCRQNITNSVLQTTE